MTKATQRDRGDGKPRCWGVPMPETVAVHDGWTDDGRLIRRVIPFAFSLECKSWASHPASEPVPQIEGWNCAGCGRYPVGRE